MNMINTILFFIGIAIVIAMSIRVLFFSKTYEQGEKTMTLGKYALIAFAAIIVFIFINLVV